jgi:hypothetical protein
LIRAAYGRFLRFGRWLHAQTQPAVITHGRLRIVPDRLIGPELQLWQDYLIELLRSHPGSDRLDLTLLLHGARARSGRSGPTRRIRFQPEHTLVKPGAAESDPAPSSRTPLPGSQDRYRFRLLHQSLLEQADLILDYCECNLRHWQDSAQADSLLRRARLLSPINLPVAHDAHARSRALVTLFSNPPGRRRAAFLAEARDHGLPVIQAGRAYRRQALTSLVDDTVVLINLRQSDHHDTFEALRVLPALARGVLVVSEDVPLRAALPYQDCVIWADRGHLLEALEDVHARRQHHWQAIFGSGRCQARLKALAAQNQRMVDEFLSQTSRNVPL